MSSAPEQPRAIPNPRPELTIEGVEAQRFAVAPTLLFKAGLTEAQDRDIFTVALSCQINVDPARRSYDPETRSALVELFGEPQRWGATTRSFMWTRADVLVPSFRGSTTFTIPVPCTFDLELAASKYFYSVADGEVPLTFHLSGSILFRGDEGEVRITQVPWASDTKFAMPVRVWQEMMGHYYPNGAWIRVGDETLERLGRLKAASGLPSYDAAVSELLEGRDDLEPDEEVSR